MSLFLKPELSNDTGSNRRSAQNTRRSRRRADTEAGLQELKSHSGFGDALQALISTLPVVVSKPKDSLTRPEEVEKLLEPKHCWKPISVQLDTEDAQAALPLTIAQRTVIVFSGS